jgi:uncharacterized protein (TIGR00251 family)
MFSPALDFGTCRVARPSNEYAKETAKLAQRRRAFFAALPSGHSPTGRRSPHQGSCQPPACPPALPWYNRSMRIRVKVNAGAQSESVRELDDGTLQVRTRAPASKGRANRRVLELLGEHLGVAAADLEIVAGHTSPVKHVEVREG